MKKKYKGIVFATFMAMNLLTGCGTKESVVEESTQNATEVSQTEESQEEVVKEEEWKQLYYDFLVRESNNFTTTSTYADYISSESGEYIEKYALVYIDDNDVPELAISYLLEEGWKNRLFQIKDGQVEEIVNEVNSGELATYGFKERTGEIAFDDGQSREDGSVYQEVYTLQNGEITKSLKLEVVDKNSDEGSSTEWRVNDKAVSEETYQEKIEAYDKDSENLYDLDYFEPADYQEVTYANIKQDFGTSDSASEDFVEPGRWLKAYIDQLPEKVFDEEDNTQYLDTSNFYDINGDNIPEMKIDMVGTDKIFYLDKDMSLQEIVGDTTWWVLSDKTLVGKGLTIQVGQLRKYTEYAYDETTGLYTEREKEEKLLQDEFIEILDEPNIDQYRIAKAESKRDIINTLQDLAKQDIASMEIFFDASEPKVEIKKDIDSMMDRRGMNEYLIAYCMNYSRMVTEKKFSYMLDFLYFGAESETEYSCETEMRRMVENDSIISMEWDDVEIEDVTKVDENTIRVRTAETYKAVYKMTLEQIKNKEDIYKQCKRDIDKSGADTDLYQVEAYVDQNVHYELKWKEGSGWKFYKYVEGVETDTIVLNCSRYNASTMSENDIKSETGDCYMEDENCSGYKMLIPSGFYFERSEDNYTSFKDSEDDTMLIWGLSERG